MSGRTTRFTPGRCARDIYAAIEAYQDDVAAARGDLMSLLARLAQEDDLLEIGLPRESNHGNAGSWLYWDGEIGIFTSAKKPALSGIATPTRIPISPPVRLTIIASVRNCS